MKGVLGANSNFSAGLPVGEFFAMIFRKEEFMTGCELRVKLHGGAEKKLR